MDNRQPASTQSKISMIGFEAALPLSKIVYDWAKERKTTATEVIRDLQKNCYTHGANENEENFLAPCEDFNCGKVLEIIPRAYFSRTGKPTKESLSAASQIITHHGGREGPAFSTDAFRMAWCFLKIPVPDAEPPNLRKMLDEFMIKREDFKRWIEHHKQHRLPRFWFESNRGKAQAGQPAATKVDAMRVEIENIIGQGTPATVEYVWRELVKRCGTEGSVCLHVEESDKGPIICWRGAINKIKRLTKNNLAEKLRTRNTG
jgi:hypothetical protein